MAKYSKPGKPPMIYGYKCQSCGNTFRSFRKIAEDKIRCKCDGKFKLAHLFHKGDS